MFEKVAVIGEGDLVFGLKAVGFKVFPCRNLEEAKKALSTVEEEGFSLCFLHEVFFAQLEKEIKSFQKKVFPVVLGFSDHRKILDYLEVKMKEMAIIATGSDSLVKRRG